jgi:hypothetical protein
MGRADPQVSPLSRRALRAISRWLLGDDLVREIPRDYQRRLAIVALLALQDPLDLFSLVDGDLRGRGYRYTQSRDPRRDPEILKRDLGTAHTEYRRHELGRDISEVVSFRKYSRPRSIDELRRRA